MEIFRAKFVRNTGSGIYVSIPALDTSGKHEFGPFIMPYAELLLDGEDLTVLSRDDTTEFMVVIGLPIMLNIDVIDGNGNNIHILNGGGA